MTKTDFFRTILKIIGIYLLFLTIFSYAPHYILYIPFEFDIYDFTWLVITFTTLLFVVYILLFKTDNIIKRLKIDKGFDEERINFEGLTSEKILIFAFIISGTFLIVDNIPNFFFQTYSAFKDQVTMKGIDYIENDNSFGTKKDYYNWTFSGLNILVGFLLLSNRNQIASWFKIK